MLSSTYSIPENFRISVPGDKSVSHRSILFSSIAKGESYISGFLEAEDPLNTMKCFEKLGVSFCKTGKGEYSVKSQGKGYLKSPDSDLDFGNGGTGIRLSAGLLSGLTGVETVLTGDASLQKRPMKRIIEPLQLMGADIASLEEEGKAPLRIKGKKLKPIHYQSKLSSAQVKSCLMLASITSDVKLEYEEPELSRDHTENIVQFLGGHLTKLSKTHFILEPPYDFSGNHYKVPGDISSAAFFLVLGLLSKSGSLVIQNIGLNPSRVGILTVLKEMGGNIRITNQRQECGEIVGDLVVIPSLLHRTEIKPELIPSMIDEIPILTIAGLFSEGGFSISNVQELRAKESDRIHAMITNLKKIGVQVDEKEDGYSFSQAENIQAAFIESFMDHRIAMSFYILKTLLGNDIQIDDDSWIDTSFPDFKSILRSM
ncbi:MAG: 3-phosphoshikimate 1-carboxyvinyltransferase [Leptospiraceae bacterium]|nr:3-phosphoshikimate 1-carboxyvinyltransferase [Leptospiraceae bacterium]MCP5496505.1 3-phosphoshikimate 1-carboxyvinyltransferase [Leptospiraceae bacterium]